MRCFVAIELPNDARLALAPALGALRAAPGLRACALEQLHITLKFLGELPEARAPQLCELVRRVTQGDPFLLRLTGLGAFPSRGAPRVLWAGVDDVEGGCARWLRDADAALADAFGAPRETRPMRPHVTLARSRSPRGAESIRRILASTPAPRPVEWRARGVTLFSSELRREGARYTTLMLAPLD